VSKTTSIPYSRNSRVKVKRLKFFLKRKKKLKEKREKRSRQYFNKSCKISHKLNKKRINLMKPNRTLKLNYKTKKSVSD